MSLRTIRELGDPVLGKRAKEVREMTPKLRQLIADMKETMYEADGVGLAAPQVGVLRRIVLVETEPGELIELINPEIVEVSEERQEGMEGCLSVPGEWGIVDRPMTVTVKAQNRNGEWFTMTGSELKARCFCHEIDHLDGTLYTSKASKMLDPDELDED